MEQKKRVRYLAIIAGVCSMLLAFVIFYKGAYATQKGTVTATSLNVRTGTGTQYSILTENNKKVQLKKGTNVTILSEKSGWYQISFQFNNKTLKGYVDKSYIHLTTTLSGNSSNQTQQQNTTGTTKYKIPAYARSSLNVRTGAGTKASQLQVSGKKVTLSVKQQITILNETVVNNVNWYYIMFTHNKKTQYGWVCGDYIQLNLSAKVDGKVRVSSYKMRTAAGSSSYMKVNNAVVTLKKDANVKIEKEIVKSSKRWYYVSFTYNNKTHRGYIEANSVYFKTPATAPTV